MGIVSFNGTPTSITKTISNPFLGNQLLSINGVYYINDQLLDGGPTPGNILVASSNNQYIRLEDDKGDLLLANFSTILLGGGDDIINLTSTTNSVDNLTINTGSGNNVVWSGAGDDEIIALDGDDILHGGPGNDTINAGAGNDVVIGGQGNDTIDAGDGFDTIIYSGSFDDYEILEENSVITISSINAQDGVDTVTGAERFQFDDGILENGVFTPFINDQVFVATLDAEVFEGTEAGNDTVDYSNSLVRVKVDLESGAGASGFAEGDQYISIENVTGSNYGTDVIFGNSAENILLGLGGHDILEGGSGADLIDGGEGRDFASYTRSDEGVNIDLTRSSQLGGDAEGDVLVNIEHVFGSRHDDVIKGDEGRNRLYGGAGSDTLSGGGGHDVLAGGWGDDTYIYTSGHDKIIECGYGEHNTLVFDDAFSIDDVFVVGNLILTNNNGDIGSIRFSSIRQIDEFVFEGVSYDLQTLKSFSFPQNKFGFFGNDTFEATQYGERFFGFFGSDTVDYNQSEQGVEVYLYANRGGAQGFSAGDHYYSIENITGSNEADIIYGNSKSNILKGSQGDDMLSGLNGNDTLYGGQGEDTLQGGNGSDRFVFEADLAFDGIDRIEDFDAHEGDKIDISDVLYGYDPGEDLITDYLEITSDGNDSLVFVDRDGAGLNHGFEQIAVIVGVLDVQDEVTLENTGVVIT